MTMRNLIRLICLVVAVVTICSVALALATDETRIRCWVLCQPDDYVNIRDKASTIGHKIGRAEVGDSFMTDGKVKDGFLHVYCSLEESEGWIYLGYIVFDEPEQIGELWVVESNGRVACRKCVDGARRCWVIDGSTLTVRYIAGEWAITDKGFIKTEFIRKGETN